MSEYKIEKDIPLPSGRGSSANYPFGDMKLGESILVNDGKHKSAVSYAHRHAKDNGGKFATRKEGEGVRIWRLA